MSHGTATAPPLRSDRSTRFGGVGWRMAGHWMVVLALGLGAAAVVLALLQARSLTNRLLGLAEVHATRIAATIDERYEQQLDLVLRVVAAHQSYRPEQGWGSTPQMPGWVDGFFVWDGAETKVLVAPTHDGRGLNAHVARHFSETLSPHAATDGFPRTAILPGREKPLVLGWQPMQLLEGSRKIIVTRIDTEKLQRDLVAPLVPAYMTIARVEAAGRKPWAQPLGDALAGLTIVPTDEFVSRQRRAVLGQTLLYLTTTTLALGTLLVAMAVLGRLVRREIALAEMKSNFVADISHELKTPLALIRMFGEMLLSGRAASDEKRNEYYKIITRESTRLSDLIEKLLDFSRVEAGRKEYAMQPIDVGAVVKDTFDAYRAQLDEQAFTHRLRVRPALPEVNADRDALAQALINLINNAIKYSEDERFLSIDVDLDTRRGRHGVLISVQDRGIGIHPEDRARLFDGFFRASDGRVRAKGGAGLGLALVKHIVDAHGGLIDVESRLVRGSTFRIFLPAATSP